MADHLDSFLDAKSEPDHFDAFLGDRPGPAATRYSKKEHSETNAPIRFQSEVYDPALEAIGRDAVIPSIKKDIFSDEPVGLLGSVIRGAPAAIAGGLTGAVAAAMALPAGPLASAYAGVRGSMAGAAGAEALREAAVNGRAYINDSSFTPPGQVALNVGSQAVANGIAEVPGQLWGLGTLPSQAFRRGALPMVGAGAMRGLATVPESSGEAALSDLGMLRRAPSDAEVETLYDKFHTASGTMSRKQFISNSADSFDTPSRALSDIKAAELKLKDGTLTTQEAINASQGARLIRDAKARGNPEFSQAMADNADRLKGLFDDFIETSVAPNTRLINAPIAQKLAPRQIMQEVGHELVPGLIRSPIAQELVQTGAVNVPTQQTGDILPDIKQVVNIVRTAKAQGMIPSSIMDDAEKSIYSRFGPQIDSAAEHRIPVETLLTGSEMNPSRAGFTERPTLGPGNMIYADKPALFPGGPIRSEKTVYLPGEIITRPQARTSDAGRTGYPEWQAARQGAYDNKVASDFSSPTPQNRNGSTNQLRAYGSIKGAIAGASTGLAGAAAAGATGHPLLAAAAALGAGASLLSPLAESPMVYGAAIRAADMTLPVIKAAGAGIKFAPGSIAAYYTAARRAIGQ